MTVTDERIERELANLGTEHQPPLGWEARVLAATETRRRPRWWLAAIPAFATLATLLVLWLRPGATTKRVELAIEIETGGTIVRGTSAHVGDVVHATIRGHGRHRALWVYRNDTELLIACPGDAGCRTSEPGVTADVTLSAPGTYTFVGLTSDTVIARPAGSLDSAVAEMMRAGGERTIEQVVVR